MLCSGVVYSLICIHSIDYDSYTVMFVLAGWSVTPIFCFASLLELYQLFFFFFFLCNCLAFHMAFCLFECIQLFLVNYLLFVIFFFRFVKHLRGIQNWAWTSYSKREN